MKKTPVLILLVCIFIFITGCVFVHRPLPKATSPGEALATKIETSINKKAWEQTHIISWNFAGATHIWDRRRKFHQYEKENIIIQHSLEGIGGIVIKDGHSSPAPYKELHRAYDAWTNDSFWLNPLVKLRDEGVVLGTLIYDQKEALLVHYTTGGNTPGDHYLWFVDENNRPTMWRMWVSIIPIGGISSSWEGWQQLETGAWVSTIHKIGPFTLDITPVQGAVQWVDLYPNDPFAPLELYLEN